VKGSTPTEAGLQLLPLMGGLLVTSIISGRIISRTGRYRLFPIGGTLLATIGMVLMTTLTLDSPLWQIYLYAAVLGMGMGMVMQVLVLAVQNSVAPDSIGVATSSVTLFRSVGGSMGVALFGAMFSHVLKSGLTTLVEKGDVLPTSLDPNAVHHLPPDVQHAYLQVFSESVHAAFQMAAGVMALAFILSLFLPESPLRSKARQ
jgi:Major Facilitator Superfamily.